MRNNRYVAFAFTLGLILLYASMASAAVAWKIPIAGSNVSTSTTGRCSYVNVTDVTTPIAANSSFSWNGSGAWVTMTKSGFTCNATDCWATLTLTGLTETKVGSFNCTIGNSSSIAGTVTAKMVVDNTNPSCTSDRAPRGEIEYGTSVKLTCSCTDSIDSSLAIKRKLTENSGSPLTISSSPYTAAGSAINTLGIAKFGCEATDSAGNYHNANLSFNIVTEEEGNQLTNQLLFINSSNINRNTKWFFLIGGLVVLTAILGTLAMFNNSKKKRRR